MSKDILKSSVYIEFFEDVNVHFPTNPKLINGISVYNMPNGLGVQFRGGSEKLIMKGKNSFIIWNFLEENLNGDQSLEAILLKANNNNFDPIEVASFIKILHSNHLFESKNKTTQEYSIDPFVENQKAYYDRVIGYTDHNDDSYQVLEKIKNAKILIIANTYLIPIISYNLYLAGFKDIGLFYIGDETNLEQVNYTHDLNIMTQVDITELDNTEMRGVLNSKIDDYQYVLTAINNPNIHFLHEITRFCNTRNKPLLNISLLENNYEIGPFFFPNSYTACATCYNLRKQSHESNSVYDFMYQNKLEEQNSKHDNRIKGFDIQGFSGILNLAISDFKNVVSSLSKSNFVNKILQVNTLKIELKNIEIIAVPGCPSCALKN
jgi:hypothetical protein